MDEILNINPFSESADESDSFGSDPITDSDVDGFPEPIHRVLKRRIFNRHRDLEEFTNSIKSDRQHSIVTGIGPSGNMHIGHIVSLYFSKYLQNQTGARVYIPISDDEKFLTRDESLQSIQDYTRRNIKDILAVGFDPTKTRIIIDSGDASLIYPLATNFASDLTPAQVESVYGDSTNIGEMFYPAVQVSHLLLPQLVYGEHRSIMISGHDQDPHVRLARDVADKTRYPVNKPGCLLSRYAPSLKRPNEKMSSSDTDPTIYLNDTKDEIENKIMKNAYSGGAKHLEKHRENGGDPTEDVSYKLLYYFFEQNEDKLADTYEGYTNGDILSGEMKERACRKIWDFISEHQARKSALDSIDEEMEDYRLTKTERQSALTRVGYSTEILFD